MPSPGLRLGSGKRPVGSLLLATLPDIAIIAGRSGRAYITGDPISDIRDASRNGRDATQSTAEYRPAIDEIGPVSLISFGEAAYSGLAIPVDWISGKTNTTWALAAARLTDDETYLTCSEDVGTSVSAGSVGTLSNAWISVHGGDADHCYASYGTPDQGMHRHITLVDGSQSGDADRMRVWLDGVPQTCSYHHAVTATVGTPISMSLGDLEPFANFGLLAVFAGWSRTLTDAEAANVDADLAALVDGAY